MLVEDLGKQQDGKQQGQQSQQQLSQKKAEEAAKDSEMYDIFISYAHRTPVEATQLYESLQLMKPDLKVFLDRSELKTGNNTQN